VDQQALAFVEMSEAVKHLISGDVVEDKADSFGRIELNGHGDEMRGGNDRILRIATDHRKSGDALAERELRDPLAESVDIANDVVTRGEWKRRDARIKAAPHQDVGVGDASGEDFDADLTRAGRREVCFDIFQPFRAALGGDNNATILLC
jgi:hypothetical protein